MPKISLIYSEEETRKLLAKAIAIENNYNKNTVKVSFNVNADFQVTVLADIIPNLEGVTAEIIE